MSSGDMGVFDGYGEYDRVPNTATGMTLRDWFAGQALRQVVKLVADLKEAVPGSDEAFIARISYSIADAMLAARGDA